jgi:hypothetical protein
MIRATWLFGGIFAIFIVAYAWGCVRPLYALLPSAIGASVLEAMLVVIAT